MKKRILAILLCAITVFSMVGCSADKESLEEISEVKSRSNNPPLTLSLYVPSLNDVSEETRVAVEKALNAISIKKYNTTLKFFAYPEDEYVPVVLEQVRTSMESYITYLNGLDTELAELEKPISYGSNSTTADMTNYPELTEAGIDIFVAFKASEDSLMRVEGSGYENFMAADQMFQMMYENRVLAPLSPRFINDYAVLKSKSYEEFFEEVTRPDINNPDIEKAKQYAYAMPNNYILGSYDFLVINKNIVKNVYNDSIDLLSPILLKEALKNTNKDATEEMLLAEGKKAEDKLNAIVSVLTDLKAAEANSETKTEIGMLDDVFVTFDSYQAYQDSPNKNFGIALIKNGDLGLPALFNEDTFDVVQYERSSFTKAECGESMFCVTRAYNKTLANQGISEDDRINRCLDILLLIQNDADFRNTLQYGVKGEHYTIGRDGVVHTSTDEYKMDPSRTGNIFLLYPTDDTKIMSPSMAKLAENSWLLAKRQNKEILESRSK